MTSTLRFAAAAHLTLLLPAAVVRAQAAETQTQILLFKPDTPSPERRRVAEAAGATVVRDLAFIDALLVRVPEVTPHAIKTLRANSAVEAIEDNAYRQWLFQSPTRRGHYPDFPSTAEALRGADRLRRPSVWPVRQGQEPAPCAALGELPWGVVRVRAPSAWTRNPGRGAKVAVIDTGIDSRHPDLSSNYAGGFNAVDPAAPPLDDNGHGTHVAGIVAAARGNGGVAGVAPEARLYAVKVLDGSGGGTPATIVEGITWAADNGMDVANMSLGGPRSEAMRRAVLAATAAGLTLVAAAGNDPQAPVAAPASYPEALAVSASTCEDALASFSATGPEIDFIAPGHQILSNAPGGRLATHSGTSMAAPHVTGLAALAVSLGAKGPVQVRAWLKAAATALPALGPAQQGAGLVDAERIGR